jgi:hypothetical protein
VLRNQQHAFIPRKSELAASLRCRRADTQKPRKQATTGVRGADRQATTQEGNILLGVELLQVLELATYLWQSSNYRTVTSRVVASCKGGYQ